MSVKPPGPKPPDDDEKAAASGEIHLTADNPKAHEEDQDIEFEGLADDPNRSRKKTKIRQKGKDQNTANPNPSNLPSDTSGLTWERIGSLAFGAVSSILVSIKNNAMDLGKALTSEKNKKMPEEEQRADDEEYAAKEENDALEMEQNAKNEGTAVEDEAEAQVTERDADLGPRLSQAEEELEDLREPGPPLAPNLNQNPPVVPKVTNASAKKVAEPRKEISLTPAEPTSRHAPRPNPRNRGSTR